MKVLIAYTVLILLHCFRIVRDGTATVGYKILIWAIRETGKYEKDAKAKEAETKAHQYKSDGGRA